MAKESPLVWNYIKPKLTFDWVQRIESPITPGFPDVHIIHEGSTIYLELKYCDSVTPTMGLRLEQRNWHTRAARHGARSFLLLRMGKMLYLLPGYDLWDEFVSRENFLSRTVFASEVGSFDSDRLHDVLINWGKTNV